MQKFHLALFAVCISLISYAQGTLPEFSTEESPIWYYVQFMRDGNIIGDKGSGKNLLISSKTKSDGNQWQFIGTANDMYMKSKSGNYVNYNGSYFTSSASEKIALRIIESPTNEGFFEIQKKDVEGLSMNQCGGTQVGYNICLYDEGNINNPLSFVESELRYPVFSDSITEQWYIINFARIEKSMKDCGEEKVIQFAHNELDDAQLWKFVGNAKKFQMVNKSGRYAYVYGSDKSSARLKTHDKADSFGFRFVETNGYFEIAPNKKQLGNYSLNPLGGANANPPEVGIWDRNDANNQITFTKELDYKSPDFKVFGAENFTPENKLTLWYTEPATTASLYSGGQGYSNWMEYSLPIGNGQFGASIFGGIARDEIQFNEKTLWSGKSSDTTSEYGRYENFGSIYAENLDEKFGYNNTNAVRDYYRLLDLTNATARVSFKNNDKSITFNREYIASSPDGVVAAHYTADEAGKIDLRFTFKNGKPRIKGTPVYNDGEATFNGKLETISYNARFKVVPTGGTMTTDKEGITVLGADEVVVILAGATDFDAYSPTYTSGTSELASKVQTLVDNASAKNWTELYNTHVADHKQYFDRCTFELSGTKNEIPTNELIDAYDNGSGANALMLEQLYFAYGRYLEIASSRGVDLPSNLQGIWSNMSAPAWNSDIHSNINVQMNYWPAEPTNLSEMHVPFLNYIINMADSPQWKAYAKKAGQNEGWTCYTENNIFGGCGGFMHNYVIANAWYCAHLWQHYRYTLDKEYLKKAFPAMWNCSRFWVLRLKLAKDGTYECPNEYSPEQGPASQNGVPHAQQLVWDLFSNTIAAAEILGDEATIDADQLAILKDRFKKLDKGLAIETYNGTWGTGAIPNGASILREWKYSPYTVGDNEHRHMSHLMCLYPFNMATTSSTYFEAAINSLKLRGDGATGWSMGWKINLWARALDGNHARKILRNALAHSKGWAGVFYNLFDSHAPFQIDGNFGACAGIAEMLMQSHTDTIQILPALPSEWKEGEIKGMKAIGNFTVDIEWSEGKATKAIIVSHKGRACYINYKDASKAFVTVNGNEVNVTKISDDVCLIPSNADDRIEIDFTKTATGIVGINEEIDKEDAIYDLMGHKIENPAASGIYIKTGKKFFVK